MRPVAVLMILSAPAIAADLPPIPDKEGFAASFAGVSGGGLVVAGGANFPGKKPWEGGTKMWHDSAFVLATPDGPWKPAGALPRPLAYGVSVATDRGLLCAGGADADRHYADCFELTWDGKALATRPFPALPKPCAYACGARVGNVVYVAGGIETPTATAALKTFWALDLTTPDAGWKALPPWPGRPRMLGVAAAHDGAFYLFSGADLHAGSDGKPVRTYLRDAYCYTPARGWAALPELPRVAVAAPSPCPVVGGKLLVVSGDDGTKVDFEPKARHPGFPTDVLAFDVAAGRWETTAGTLSRATVPVVRWGGRDLIVGGEVRPGVRTPAVSEVGR